MNKLLLNVLFCGVLAAGFAIIGADMALAGTNAAFDKITLKAVDIFNNVRSVIFIVGGFALMVLAVAAIFGKMDWKAFAYLGIGLIILALAGSVIGFFVGETNITDLTDV